MLILNRKSLTIATIYKF